MPIEQLELVLPRPSAERRVRSRSPTRSSKRCGRGWAFSANVGLTYLTLARSATTLSGGESQRIRLATQIGSALVGVLYILDEPSIGLHQRDNDRLLATLKTLRDLGNTLIVIEHDEDTMRTADVVVDIGPGAGAEGGEILTVGTLEDIVANPQSETGAYLSRPEVHPGSPTPAYAARLARSAQRARQQRLGYRRALSDRRRSARVTGVSGSGKSTLVNEVLVRALNQHLHGQPAGGTYGTVKGAGQLDKLVVIDQSPIGRTPRCNPATYTGTFDYIRELFSMVPEARMRGYAPGPVFVQRQGRPLRGVPRRRHHQDRDALPARRLRAVRGMQGQTLQRADARGEVQGEDDLRRPRDARRRGRRTSSKASRASHNKLKTICEVGLGYIKMGQPATTLSGGEAQRVKLATELSRRSTGRTFYVLDEPTTGLHFADIHKLLEVLQRLVATGNTVLVIEHNLDVIKTADYLIDLGPEGGDRGGTVVATGTPEEVAADERSYTGQYLAPVLRDQRAVGHHRADAAELDRASSARTCRFSTILRRATASPSKPSSVRKNSRLGN